MATAYPGAIDALNNPTAADNLDTASVLHTAQHTNVNDAVEAIETELGTNPKGSALSVKARLDAIDTALASKALAADEGAANGIATLDGSSKLVQSFDASKASSGTFDVARIPNISGAKVFGTVGGGAAIPVDAVPDIPASKTTSGEFDAARIPGLDASKTITGVFDKARIPTDFGATAIVKADVPARDAITLANRTDGMLVFVRSPNSLWMWRAEISKWQLVKQNVIALGDYNTNTTATFTDITEFKFNAQAGVNYGIDVVLFITSGSSTPDIRYGFSWTGAGTMHFGHNGPDTGINAAAASGWTGAAIYGDATSPADHTSGIGIFAGSSFVVRVYGTFICTGDGVVQMRHSQMTANAVPSTTRIGSRFKVESY